MRGTAIKIQGVPGLNHQTTGSVYNTQHMKKHGYPGEAHRVITPDGYILTLDRIPHRENSTSDRMPLILLHGMVGNAMQYLIAGPRSGLGYICADAGFDVWLVNYRGTMLSREHVKKLKPKEYWDFRNPRLNDEENFPKHSKR
ncbi:unnamed protein product [Bemisia tabaci]|uniref:Partial AB-hydrolase lipase domain-containing protein n=1 Tax=Bemisia tabaci TaxID=7038 RepID=A0A9P0AJW6_BEMTA|nr:unnamed protein product [Bemisia tabaci]